MMAKNLPNNTFLKYTTSKQPYWHDQMASQVVTYLSKHINSKVIGTQSNTSVAMDSESYPTDKSVVPSVKSNSQQSQVNNSVVSQQASSLEHSQTHPIPTYSSPTTSHHIESAEDQSFQYTESDMEELNIRDSNGGIEDNPLNEPSSSVEAIPGELEDDRTNLTCTICLEWPFNPVK